MPWQGPISGVSRGDIYSGAKENGPSRARTWDIPETWIGLFSFIYYLYT